MITGSDSLRVADAIIEAGLLPSRYAVSKSLMGCRDEYLYDRARRPDGLVGEPVVARLKSRLFQLASTTPADTSRNITRIMAMIEQAEAIAVFIAR